VVQAVFEFMLSRQMGVMVLNHIKEALAEDGKYSATASQLEHSWDSLQLTYKARSSGQMEATKLYP